MGPKSPNTVNQATVFETDNESRTTTLLHMHRYIPSMELLEDGFNPWNARNACVCVYVSLIFHSAQNENKNTNETVPHLPGRLAMGSHEF